MEGFRRCVCFSTHTTCDTRSQSTKERKRKKRNKYPDQKIFLRILFLAIVLPLFALVAHRIHKFCFVDVGKLLFWLLWFVHACTTRSSIYRLLVCTRRRYKPSFAFSMCVNWANDTMTEERKKWTSRFRVSHSRWHKHTQNGINSSKYSFVFNRLADELLSQYNWLWSSNEPSNLSRCSSFHTLLFTQNTRPSNRRRRLATATTNV